MMVMKGFRLILVCAVGPGSAADACGVTNKGGCELIKPSDDDCFGTGMRLDGKRNQEYVEEGRVVYDELKNCRVEELKTED